jgi:hypothetical protein
LLIGTCRLSADGMRQHGRVARMFRRAAKVLLLDPKQRVLLFSGSAVRVQTMRLGGFQWAEGLNPAKNRPQRRERGLKRQALPVNEFEPVAARWSDTEYATMRGHRWWSIEELRATTEPVYPDGLAERVERLRATEQRAQSAYAVTPSR